MLFNGKLIQIFISLFFVQFFLMLQLSSFQVRAFSRVHFSPHLQRISFNTRLFSTNVHTVESEPPIENKKSEIHPKFAETEKHFAKLGITSGLMNALAHQSK
jgi:hypothetical protein